MSRREHFDPKDLVELHRGHISVKTMLVDPKGSTYQRLVDGVILSRFWRTDEKVRASLICRTGEDAQRSATLAIVTVRYPQGHNKNRPLFRLGNLRSVVETMNYRRPDIVHSLIVCKMIQDGKLRIGRLVIPIFVAPGYSKEMVDNQRKHFLLAKCGENGNVIKAVRKDNKTVYDVRHSFLYEY